MGIESDRLVYAYLSRVGDLAQQRQVPSGDRMRLVAGLRDEIDRMRSRYEPESPAAVRRILERMGTPEEVLAGLGPTAEPGPGPDASPGPAPGPPTAVPVQRSGDPKPGSASASAPEPDWWRVTPGRGASAPFEELHQVEGFVGGVEIPELFDPPEHGAKDTAEDPAATAPPKQTLARYLRERWRAKRAAVPAPGPETPGPAGPAGGPAARPKPHAFLLLAAAVLVVGAVTGYWLLLIGGWLLAYASRVLGPTERKVVVFGLPGAVFATAVVWLWGRLDGRWGAPLTDEGLGGVFQGMWPWLARAAAIASAAYLGWRSRRR
ncbi:hypothetical protein AB0F11_34945 [Streptomyces sp. NPDC032472]|uniref:hypothetical protein n=1 Tax=Streptomyces sp. NPDC032472 TaxID=3155018 RepID=UPI003401A875